MTETPKFTWFHLGCGDSANVKAVPWVADESGGGWVYEIELPCTAAEIASIARQLAEREAMARGEVLTTTDWASMQRDAGVELDEVSDDDD